ncbi:MAG TPA: hypothetical protein VGM39_25815 [Kofleriaceae bacterium]|jgi:hypothetical protein
MSDDDEPLVAERIDEFDIAFSRPEFWEFRVEHENTYLYWDEDAGSMRITPLRASTAIDRYLASSFDKENERGHAPERKTIGERNAVAWVVDTPETETRCHYVLTGRDDVIILCSYAFDPVLYEEDDEFYGPAIDAGLEYFEAAIQSLRF